MFDDLIRNPLNDLSAYIPGRQIEEVKKEFGLNDVIKLASNENPLGPSPKALDAIKNKLNELHIYPDQNSLALKAAISQKINTSPDNIIIGNGSDEIMLMIAQAFLSAGDEVIISKKTFSTYEFVTKLMDAKPIYTDLLDYTYDLDLMSKSITNKTKLIFLCNPNNPTGTIFSASYLKEFLGNIPQNILVAIDEAYGDYCDDPGFISGTEFTADFKNLIVLKTFSKIYGLAALRAGYGIGDLNIIKYLNLVKLPFNVNSLAQSAAAAALSDNDFIDKSLQNNAAGKKFLYKEFNNIGLEYLNTQANFIFIKIKDADSIFINLLSKGVIIRPLKSFGFSNAIRATIGTQTQNEMFIFALKESMNNG